MKKLRIATLALLAVFVLFSMSCSALWTGSIRFINNTGSTVECYIDGYFMDYAYAYSSLLVYNIQEGVHAVDGYYYGAPTPFYSVWATVYAGSTTNCYMP